jgi:hypothetical protein
MVVVVTVVASFLNVFMVFYVILTRDTSREDKSGHSVDRKAKIKRRIQSQR